MNTPTWAQLHAMEPGLRPAHCDEPDCGILLMPWSRPEEPGRVNWWWAHEPELHPSPIGPDGVASENHGRMISAKHADALCRDRATDVLGSLGCYVSPEGASGWAVWKSDGDDTYAKVEGLHTTRDEALRAACAAVIGERKPLKPCCTPGGCRCSRPSEPGTPS